MMSPARVDRRSFTLIAPDQQRFPTAGRHVSNVQQIRHPCEMIRQIETSYRARSEVPLCVPRQVPRSKDCSTISFGLIRCGSPSFVSSESVKTGEPDECFLHARPAETSELESANTRL